MALSGWEAFIIVTVSEESRVISVCSLRFPLTDEGCVWAHLVVREPHCFCSPQGWETVEEEAGMPSCRRKHLSHIMGCRGVCVAPEGSLPIGGQLKGRQVLAKRTFQQ